MSLLTDLSNASKARRKPDRDDLLFACDYPVRTEEAGNNRTASDTPRAASEPPPQVDETNIPLQANGESPQKPRPVPVVAADPLELMEPDAYGAELGKEARVWKVYVKETDRWDAELVDGWNKSLDVILVFAALFSAISTAFLIESSKKLQQDPNDTSAAALLVISQTLTAMVNNSVADAPTPNLESNLVPSFVPPRNAVVVNILWYLSLSLSVATSLLSMLAKDWCRSFAADRTGHPWDQALRRQRKWVMIERWKMKQLIAVLPSIIHVSLLLFAVGLCIYVWDLNSTVAIPVICVTAVVFVFYVGSSIMASLVELFPYTTIISRVLQSNFMRRLYNTGTAYGKTRSARVMHWISQQFEFSLTQPSGDPKPIMIVVLLPLFIWNLFRSFFSLNEAYANTYGFLLWLDFNAQSGHPEIMELIGSLGLLGPPRRKRKPAVPHQPRKGDQDQMTSLALKWLIQHCETPGSITIALQAIAGASPRIPKGPLESCGATLQILRRLVSTRDATESDMTLYSRALAVLVSQNQSEQGRQEVINRGDIEVVIWDFHSAHESQIVDLINNTAFSPTSENLKALAIGSNAASFGLRLLKGPDQHVSETFVSIINRLMDHFDSDNNKLDPAALQSLGNAAVLITSCSPTCLMPPALLKKCIAYCIRVVLERLQYPQPNEVIDPITVFLICILLSGCHQEDMAAGHIHLTTGARIEAAARLLTDRHLRTPRFREAFKRIGVFEIIFNPKKYGLDEYILHYLQDNIGDPLVAFQLITQSRTASELLRVLVRDESVMRRIIATGNFERNPELDIYELLVAMDLVNECVVSSASQITPVNAPPPIIFLALVFVTCNTRTDAEQLLCGKILSKMAFPGPNYYIEPMMNRLSSFILRMCQSRVLPPPSTQSTRFSLSRFWHRKIEPKHQVRLRHFVATQTWLSDYHLYLLNERQGIPVQAPVARNRLEGEIIQGYLTGSHLGGYSARIVECILERWEIPGDHELSIRIKRDLANVSPRIRGLSSIKSYYIQPQPHLQPPSTESGPSSVSTFERALATELPLSRTTTPSTASIHARFGRGGADSGALRDDSSHISIPMPSGPPRSEDT